MTPVVPPAAVRAWITGILAAAMLGMALTFFVVGLVSDAPVMASEVYGEGVGRYPAEWWAGSIMVFSGLMLFGAMRPPGVAPRLLGAVAQVVVLTAFIRGGLGAPAGAALAIWAAWVLALHILALWWALMDGLTLMHRSARWSRR